MQDSQREISDNEQPEDDDQVEMIMSNSSQAQAQYQQKLEAKISLQAQRLCEFQQYSSLCEKRIKQLCPSHPFPITQAHLSQSISSYFKETDYDKLQKSFSELQLKYKTLNEEHQRQQKEKKDSLDALLKQNFIMFPSVERIPSEKIYDAYKKIYDAYKKLFCEKETAVSSLKQEIINNDQQRNYIEILKETIESSLIKSGIKNKIESSMSVGQGKDFTGTIVEITQLHNEIEKLKSYNTALELSYSQLQNKLDFYNSNANTFKGKIQETLENGIRELEDAKTKVRMLESEKESLANKLSEASLYNERLKDIVKKFEDDNTDTNNKVMKMQKTFEEKAKNQSTTISKLKEENEKLTALNEELVKNNDVLKENRKMLTEENASLKNENQFHIKDNKDMFNTEIAKLKNQLFSIEKERKTLQNVNNELSSDILRIKSELASSVEENEKINARLQKEIQSNKNVIDDMYSNQKELELALMKKEEIIKQQQQMLQQFQGPINNQCDLNHNNKEELKVLMYQCLNSINTFLQNCKKAQCNVNTPMMELINDIKTVSELFDKCYKSLSSSKSNYKSKSGYSSFTASSSPDHSNINRQYDSINDSNSKHQQDNLIKELKSFKSDNKKLYEYNKKLMEENMNAFFLTKENKFLMKFLNRIIKNHIENYDIKNLLNDILLINDNALNLEMDKTKIENKIANYSTNKDPSQINEKNKSKDLIKQIESQIEEKFMQLKALDHDLKQYECN